MGCCPTHDGIKLASDALREALLLPNLSDKSRKWLEEKLVESVEREAILVERPDGTFCTGLTVHR